MSYEFTELYDSMSRDKIVSNSLFSFEKSISPKNDFSYIVEHQELAFMVPYFLSCNNNAITRIVTDQLPEYDMIIWRTKPEITYMKYLRPLTVDFIYNYGFPEAKCVEFEGDITPASNPDFIKFYSRFSLLKDYKQVNLKFLECLA